MKPFRRARLRTRVMLAALGGLSVCVAVVTGVLVTSYSAQVGGVARDRLERDMNVVRAQLEITRQDLTKVASLIADDPPVASGLESREASFGNVIGPLHNQIAPEAQVLAVVDTKGQVVSADPFTQLQLANDAPVKAALQGVRDTSAVSRNSGLLVHNGYPALAYEAAWPVRSGGKVIGAVVLLHQVADDTLNTALGTAGLQGAIVAPQQRAVFAATTELRRLNSDRQLTEPFFAASGQAGAVTPLSAGGRSYYFTSSSLLTQPVPVNFMVGVSGASIDADAAALERRTVEIGAVALLGLGVLEWLLLRMLFRPLNLLERQARAALAAAGGQEIDEPRLPADVSAIQAALDCLADQLSSAQRLQARDRSRLEGIMDSMAEGVVVSDLQRRITYINPVAKRLLGLHSGNGSSQMPRDLIPAGGARDAVEVTVNSQLLKTRSSAIIGDDGQTSGYVTVLRDAAQETELERLKSEFVGVVSHELRTPLTSIKGSIDLLLDDDTGELNPVQRRFLSTIRRSSDRLINLVNDLLDLSRLEAGRMQLDCHPVDVVHLIGDTANGLANLFSAKKQTLNVQAEGPLPPVLADRQRLEQVLVNLLGNASKYTPERGSIAVEAHQEGKRVLVDVEDSGPGLSPGEMERVFDKFYRVGDSLTQQQPGSGLGLSIARSLVELHGGDLWVTSEPGTGSVFHMSLPVYEEEE